MTRRITPSNERIMFPAWSAEVEYSESYIPIRQRRKQNRKVGVVIATFAIIIIFLYCKYVIKGTDAVLGHALSEKDLRDLHIAHLPVIHVPSGNPWRGAGRRRRRDLLRSVSGCGGAYRPSISVGDSVSLRYAVRSADGSLIDSSRDPSDVVVGSDQLSKDVEAGLIGLCQGESARFTTRDKRRILVYIERIGNPFVSKLAEEDLLAETVIPTAGRKGKSCASTCASHSWHCNENAFRVINNCPRLRQAFDCVKCEVAAAGSGGPDMPAYVLLTAPVGHARGACLASPYVSQSRCDAKYQFTRRLCPCFRKKPIPKQ